MKRSFWIIGIFLCFLTVFYPQNLLAQNAKALFYDRTTGVTIPSPAPNAEKPATKVESPASLISNTGVRYWIELEHPGSNEMLRVNADRTFRSGERIRVHYAANTDGHLYILQKGSRGKTSLLFPSRPGSRENFVKPGQDFAAPDPGWFRFDEYPGYEQLLILFLPEKGDPAVLKKINSLSADASAFQDQIERIVYQHKGSRDLVAEFDNSYFKLNPSSIGASVNSQDPELGKVPVGTTPPAAYVVNRAESMYAPPVVFEIFLKHE